MTRKIIHFDADCFFAAIEMRDNPVLRHEPIAVGGSAFRRGVISTCNYEARRFGVRSAMATREALGLCPHLQVLPPAMEKYRRVSNELKEIFCNYSDQVEMVSVDEAYLDVSDIQSHRGSATLLAREIRKRVEDKIGITVSAGVAHNKFLAKVASEWRKPNGLFVIPPEQALEFLSSLPVRKIQGVGKVTAAKLQNQGIYTCGELARQPVASLIRDFGQLGGRLHELARGIDNRPVSSNRVRKSLSVEQTFAQDIDSRELRLTELHSLWKKLLHRLGQLPDTYRIARMHAKVKFADFTQTTMEERGTQADLETFTALIENCVCKRPQPLRLLGIGVHFADTLAATDQHQLQLPFANSVNF